jgi:hypothetical protein
MYRTHRRFRRVNHRFEAVERSLDRLSADLEQQQLRHASDKTERPFGALS